MDIGCITIVILAQTKTDAETKKNKQKGDIKMKAYKGFDKDLKCRGFQYEIGKQYEEKEVELCEKGFHACTNPLNVFKYYPPCYENRYCEVEQDGDFSKSSNDFKVASTKIKIGDEIGLTGLVRAAIEKSCESGVESINGGCYTVAIGADNHSIAANTGERSVTTSNGASSVAISTGLQSIAIGSGDQSIALNIGGNGGASVKNADSIAIAVGNQSRAKAGLGSAIVLVERTSWNGKDYPINNIKAAIVDGEKIKADTWYTLRNGEFVECD